LTLLALFSIASSRSEIIDRVVAVVNGEVITMSMMEDAINAVWVEGASPPGTQQDLLQMLIDHKLELQEARKLGVIVSEEELSREVAMAASRFPSPKEFSEALKQRGIAQEDLETSMIERIMIQKMIDREFRLFVEMADIEGEAMDFFERNKEKFVIPEEVQLNQIFFKLDPDSDESAKESLKKKAGEVLSDLKSGADFLKYAGKEGTVDYTPVDKLIPIVASAVSRLKVDEISNLIETPVGYFIIKLIDRKPSRSASFDDVKEEIKANLRQQKTDAMLEEWLKKQREQADIRLKVKL